VQFDSNEESKRDVNCKKNPKNGRVHNNDQRLLELYHLQIAADQGLLELRIPLVELNGNIPMSNTLRPHPLAALFPELPPEELAELARDIRERGQLEPIILHKGLILDGRNRYRACQIASVKPQTEEFNSKATKRSPSEFVLSRNLRRRHLSLGQKAAIALEWSEQAELSPDPDKNRGRGRPKGALTEAAKTSVSISKESSRCVKLETQTRPCIGR